MPNDVFLFRFWRNFYSVLIVWKLEGNISVGWCVRANIEIFYVKLESIRFKYSVYLMKQVWSLNIPYTSLPKVTKTFKSTT